MRKRRVGFNCLRGEKTQSWKVSSCIINSNGTGCSVEGRPCQSPLLPVPIPTVSLQTFIPRKDCLPLGAVTPSSTLVREAKLPPKSVSGHKKVFCPWDPVPFSIRPHFPPLLLHVVEFCEGSCRLAPFLSGPFGNAEGELAAPFHCWQNLAPAQ